MGRGLVGTLLRYPYEVRSEDEYFDEIQDVKVTKDMLDLAKHIVNQKSGRFEPEKFEDHYESALVDLINRKRSGKPITPKERPAAGNVVDLMEALRRSVGKEAAPAKAAKPTKKPRKADRRKCWCRSRARSPRRVPRRSLRPGRGGSQRRPASVVCVGATHCSDFRFRQHREHQPTCCWLDSVAIDPSRTSRAATNAWPV
jgi:hypothetical protein